jgi:hypothetical protein
MENPTTVYTDTIKELRLELSSLTQLYAKALAERDSALAELAKYKGRR